MDFFIFFYFLFYMWAPKSGEKERIWENVSKGSKQTVGVYGIQN